MDHKIKGAYVSLLISLVQLFIILSLCIFLLIYYKKNKKLLNGINRFVKKLHNIKSEMELKEIAFVKERNLLHFQIAHEMRSPTVPLLSFIAAVEGLPEESRKLLRQAVHRIQDISYSILNNKQKKEDKIEVMHYANEKHTVQLLSTLLQDIISEKRLVYKEFLGVEIYAEFGLSSYGLFVKIPLVEFKKVISQLIDNSVETIANHGKVKIRLSANSENIFMFITNNSYNKNTKTIPKVILSESNRLKISTRGSALCHAKSVVESIGGKFEFRVQFGAEASVKIILPKAEVPNWYATSIQIKPYSYIVIIDEDPSIHSLWQERFKNSYLHDYNIYLIHFSQPKDAISWNESLDSSIEFNKYYLCEMEFANDSMNGFDFLSLIQFESNFYIVSNKFTDNKISNLYEQKKFKIIPKDSLFFIPIDILKPKEKPCAVLIEEDSLVKMIWHLTAQSKNKKIVLYRNLEKFIQDFELFDCHTPIYIDMTYLSKKSQNKLVVKIYRQGFKHLYLITGQNPKDYAAANWIKGIVSNQPPWL